MFDVGFWEIVLLSVMALVFLGPKKLPKVVSTVGRWVGRARVMARSLRTQLEREVHLEQIKEDIETIEKDVGKPLSEDFMEAVKTVAEEPPEKDG